MYTEHGLARVLYGLGKYDDARNRCESILGRLGADIAEDHTFRGIVFVWLGKCLTALERYQEAEPTLQKAQALLLKKVGPGHKLARTAAEALEELRQRSDPTRAGKNDRPEDPMR